MPETLDKKILDRRIMHLGLTYWQKMQGDYPSLFDPGYWQGQLLDWVMKDDALKTDGFRFVDVLPALQSGEQISEHVRDYLLKEDHNLPILVRSALAMAAGGITSPLATGIIRKNVTEMARNFICQHEPQMIIDQLTSLAQNNLTFTADILGEATTSEPEANISLQKYMDLIDLLATTCEKLPDNATLYESHTGPLPKANISVKLSALETYLDPVDRKGSVSRLKTRLLPLLKHAKDKNVFINFDLEQWALHDITYDLFVELAMDPALIDWPHIGIVLQAYLKAGEDDCNQLLELAKRRGTPFTIRLVKGAYWDYEVVHARQNGFECPVWTNKARSDLSYENLSQQLLQNIDLVQPAFASHNLRSLLHAIAVAEKLDAPKNSYEIQMLYGMAESQWRLLASEGFRVRIYTPMGELLPGMAYLVRRLLENTSNSGFLRQSYHEGVAIESMLAPPVPGPELPEPELMNSEDLHSSFSNVNLLDFSDQSIEAKFAANIDAMVMQLPKKIPLVVAGKNITMPAPANHVSPNNPEMMIAQTSQATIKEAEKALNIAAECWPTWRDTPLKERATLLDRVGDLLNKNRFSLAALQTLEAGKPWKEADADVAEAIDFCHYYARQALVELGPQKQGNMAGEDNVLFFEGRGPTVVIAPWNFPLAILCGMTTASLVAGNTVIIKPAGAGCAIAYEFYQFLMEAGFSGEVVQFLPGPGREVGNFLVEHPGISQIAFTGSKEVGLDIIEKAGKTLPGQPQVKRVVCEMGGKNAVIIDEDADLDSAVKGIIHSAFGYAGQKCSACSRLIIVGGIYETFKKRLIDACKSLPMAAATDPSCHLGPVIDQAAHERLNTLIENPPAGAQRLFLGEAPSPGFFIPPALFETNDPLNPMLQEEYFGPVLTIIHAEEFIEAITIANSSEFALTGGVYSRSPSNIALARQQFKVGNLYINRGCTGAIVDRQPFGGFGMSGIGTKAGGPGYLRHFANPRCITENTMRSGFTPDFKM